MARRFSALIQRSTRFAALVAALALTMLMAVPAFAADLEQDTPIAWNDAGFQGSADECENAGLEPGEVLWHFIQNQTSSTSGTLTATFDIAGARVVNGSGNNNIHFFVVTGEDTLESASSNVADGKLLLSHICYGGPVPEIPEAPVALLLPAMAVLAFGAYLVINRRRVTDVA